MASLVAHSPPLMPHVVPELPTNLLSPHSPLPPEPPLRQTLCNPATCHSIHTSLTKQTTTPLQWTHMLPNTLAPRVYHGCRYSHGVLVMSVTGSGVVLDSAICDEPLPVPAVYGYFTGLLTGMQHSHLQPSLDHFFFFFFDIFIVYIHIAPSDMDM
jgi:hypothetical protein